MPLDKGMRVLIVEDSNAMRKMERAILKKLGFENVLEASDGQNAIELMQDGEKIDLLISDWNMPRISGLELLQWVRTEPGRRELPFIMATARGERKETEAASAAGASGFVPKPFTAEDLLKEIELIFGERKIEEKAETFKPDILPDGRLNLTIGHIQITDHIILGVLKELIEEGDISPRNFALNTICSAGWNPVANGLERGELDGAFILAPIAVDLFSYQVPIRLVLLAHRNGSIFVRNRLHTQDPAEAFRGRNFFIPHRLSIHHMLSHLYFSKLGLRPGVPGSAEVDVTFEVVPPARMPELLAASPDAGGFMVAEPLGTKAISANSASLEFLSSEAWPNHPCCVVTLRREVIEAHPEAVQEFVSLLVEAGRFVADHPRRAAEIGVKFLDPKRELNLNSHILTNVLTEEEGIKTDELFPVREDLEQMQDYMVESMGIGARVDLNDFLDLRFAREAYRDRPASLNIRSELRIDSLIARTRARRNTESMTKVMLGKEGKYLLFRVDTHDYGISIGKMREIIACQEITPLPDSPHYLKGMINLREEVIPIVDLRLWFGLEIFDYGDRSAILIIESETARRCKPVGILVESVEEIVDIDAGSVEAAPSLISGAEYVLAMAKLEGSVKILVDVDRILDGTQPLIA